MNKLLILLCLCSVLSASCSKKETQKCYQYLPNTSKLEKGLVWKYYIHNEQEHNHPWVDISYKKITKTDDTIHTCIYNAGFQRTQAYSYLVNNDQWETIKGTIFDPETQVAYPNEISAENIFIDWLNHTTKSLASVTYPSATCTFTNTQTSLSETIYNNITCLNVTSTVETQCDFDSGSRTYERQDTSIYQPSIGLVARISKSENSKTTYELDEIMTAAEFEKRANHGLHRVGYIDTTSVMDKDKNFTICNYFNQINDYYNEDDAQFLGGKGRLWSVLEQKLNKSLLQGQSGYLSYHFVINCEGKASWFTTVECDLDYTPNNFSAELKQHLFEILYEEKEWKPLSIRGEKRDAYTYITFKIKDGEIIELLP